MLHRALYGNVGLERGKCSSCNRMALVIDGEYACCGKRPRGAVAKTKRMSLPFQGRTQPPKKDQVRLLEEFDHCCAYCRKRFGSWYLYKGKPRKVQLNWDHAVPFIYAQNNQPENFLPACRTCNAWKHSKTFANIEEVRVYVAEKWERESKGDEDM